jgi:hypothetical protein
MWNALVVVVAAAELRAAEMVSHPEAEAAEAEVTREGGST